MNTPTIPKFELRHRLALMREHAGLTSQQMADELGVHRNTVTNYESGNSIPKLGALRAWCHICGMDAPRTTQLAAHRRRGLAPPRHV